MARRRGQLTGYLYKRGPSWFLQYRVDNPDKRDEKGNPTRAIVTEKIGRARGQEALTRKQAERIAYLDFLAPLDRMSTRPQSMKTIREFVKERFEPDVVWSCKPSGKKHYKHMLEKHVLPALGDLRLRELRTHHVQDLVRAKLESGLSGKTARHIRNTLSAIFTHAKRVQAYAGDLPTDGVRLPACTAPEKQALTWAQVQALAAWIGLIEPKPLKKHGHRRWTSEDGEEWNQKLGPLVIVLAITGLRIGEAMGLRWKRVNLTDQAVMVDGEFIPPYTMAIRENYVLGAYGSLKTRKSRRNIPLTVELLAAFGRLRRGAPDAPVFVSARGTPLDQHNIAARFLKPAGARKEVNASWVSWHVLRHTSATLADQVGMSVTERQRVLGHSSADMALHYTHAELEVVRAKMEKIGKQTIQ